MNRLRNRLAEDNLINSVLVIDYIRQFEPDSEEIIGLIQDLCARVTLKDLERDGDDDSGDDDDAQESTSVDSDSESDD